jgi:hypothetical protein
MPAPVLMPTGTGKTAEDAKNASQPAENHIEQDQTQAQAELAS